MRNENFFGCAALCVLGCVADSASPIMDVSVAIVAVGS
jgi:hypothetical protein